MRNAIIKDGSVINVIELAPGTAWSVPPGMSVVPSDDAGIGWSYAAGVFSPPDPLPVAPIPSPTQDQRDALSITRRNHADLTELEKTRMAQLNLKANLNGGRL